MIKIFKKGKLIKELAAMMAVTIVALCFSFAASSESVVDTKFVSMMIDV